MLYLAGLGLEDEVGVRIIFDQILVKHVLDYEEHYSIYNFKYVNH